MTTEQITLVLERLGCPMEKCVEMAAQLDKRARQLSVESGRSYDEAIAHLLKLLQSGWAAQERGGPPSA